MEILAITAATLTHHVLANYCPDNSSKLTAVSDPEILAVFKDMKNRMGLSYEDISLVEYNKMKSVGGAQTTFFGKKFIYIKTQTIRKETLAFTMAHELAHIDNRDPRRGHFFSLVCRITIGITIVYFAGIFLLPVAFCVASIISEFLRTRVHSRWIEHQADLKAAKVLTTVELGKEITDQTVQLVIGLQKRAKEELNLKWWQRHKYDKDGNMLYDYRHPPRTDLIKLLMVQEARKLSLEIPVMV